MYSEIVVFIFGLHYHYWRSISISMGGYQCTFVGCSIILCKLSTRWDIFRFLGVRFLHSLLFTFITRGCRDGRDYAGGGYSGCTISRFCASSSSFSVIRYATLNSRNFLLGGTVQSDFGVISELFVGLSFAESCKTGAPDGMGPLLTAVCNFPDLSILSCGSWPTTRSRGNFGCLILVGTVP